MSPCSVTSGEDLAAGVMTGVSRVLQEQGRSKKFSSLGRLVPAISLERIYTFHFPSNEHNSDVRERKPFSDAGRAQEGQRAQRQDWEKVVVQFTMEHETNQKILGKKSQIYLNVYIWRNSQLQDWHIRTSSTCTMGNKSHNFIVRFLHLNF